MDYLKTFIDKRKKEKQLSDARDADLAQSRKDNEAPLRSLTRSEELIQKKVAELREKKKREKPTPGYE